MEDAVGRVSKAKKTQTGRLGLDKQSQMRWWTNGDITCSGMHHKSWGKMHRMSIFEVYQEVVVAAG